MESLLEKRDTRRTRNDVVHFFVHPCAGHTQHLNGQPSFNKYQDSYLEVAKSSYSIHFRSPAQWQVVDKAPVANRAEDLTGVMMAALAALSALVAVVVILVAVNRLALDLEDPEVESSPEHEVEVAGDYLTNQRSSEQCHHLQSVLPYGIRPQSLFDCLNRFTSQLPQPLADPKTISPTAPPPSQYVREFEDKIERSSRELSLQSLNLDGSSAIFPQRPGYGTRGQRVVLWANYFELVPPKEMQLFRYIVQHLGKRPPVGKKANWVIKLMLEKYFSQESDLVTDYASTIISSAPLSLDRDIFDVQYRSEQQNEPPPGAMTYRLRISPSTTLLLSEFVKYISDPIANRAYDKYDIIQAMNIILGYHAKSNPSVLSVGANKHFAIKENSERRAIGGGFEGLRGYLLSVRATASRILVNVQVKHIACYEPIALRSLIDHSEYLSKSEYLGNLQRLEKFLMLVRVRVTHVAEKNADGQDKPRLKTIAGLARPSDGRALPNPPRVPAYGAGPKHVQFHFRDQAQTQGGISKKGTKSQPTPARASVAGAYITVAEFFKRAYNISVREDYPVVNVGTREDPIYLPIDVCVVEPGQAYHAKLSPAATRGMIQHAVRPPLSNMASITTNGVKVLGLGTPRTPQLAKFELSISPGLVTVQGRVLDCPRVTYQGNKTVDPKFGSWNMVDTKFTSTRNLPSWSYLCISRRAKDASADALDLPASIAALQEVLQACGVGAASLITGPRGVSLEGSSAEIEAAIEERFDTFAVHGVKFMLVILPNDDAWTYNTVKRLGDIQKGIHTVCVLSSKLKMRNKQTLANIALKFNLKLGGVNQTLPPAKLGILAEGKTMVVGLDVTHPSPRSASNAPSVAAIVASVDKTLGQWPADIRIQERRHEMVSDLKVLFQSRLRLWQKNNNNKALPENILIYRDGVSEGEYRRILEIELPQIRSACQAVYPATDSQRGLPHTTIVVVGKRHNTRFYPTQARDADRSHNPRNGTVVDRGVTEAMSWDFLLQAHTALKGTARPAHYYVVHDEIFRQRARRLGGGSSGGGGGASHNVQAAAADALEDLTHNLCYLFGRATKAVSICPPAYYADLVCDRARRWLSAIFEEGGASSLSAAGSVANGAAALPIVTASQVRVHENLKDSMFYI